MNVLGSANRRLRETAQGQPDAVRAFVAEHWDRLYRAAYLISYDRGVAEDIAQEAMLKALDGLDGFDTGRPLEPWLNAIAANAARDWLRARSRRPELLDDGSLQDEPAGEGLSAEIAYSSLPEELNSALARLEPGFRAVVVMRHLLGLETDEIAAILAIAPATVRTRDRRALQRLRNELPTREERNG